MKRINVRVCLLGYQRHYDVLNRLNNFHSKIFKIVDTKKIDHLPECDYEWGYSDEAITKILKAKKVCNNDVDLCLCFIDTPIFLNYYTRDLKIFDEKTVLCTFYDADEIFAQNKIDLFNYVHGIVLNETIQIVTNHKVDENQFCHTDTRGCIFDHCGNKKDIIIKYSKPKLCMECRNKIAGELVNNDFIDLLEAEFKTMRKKLFIRIIDFIESHTIFSMLIYFVVSVLINLISSILFEFFIDPYLQSVGIC